MLFVKFWNQCKGDKKNYINNILASEKYLDKSGNTVREKTNCIYTDYTYGNVGSVVTRFVIDSKSSYFNDLPMMSGRTKVDTMCQLLLFRFK